MSKIIYDVIQRFEVENGIPRLVSTNIQVIQGGEDLLSLAIKLLEETQPLLTTMFDKNITSQYIGYRMQFMGKPSRRYQLILAQRKDSLAISIPKETLNPYLLKLSFSSQSFQENTDSPKAKSKARLFWIIPSKEDVFIKISQAYANVEPVGNFNLDKIIKRDPTEYIETLNKSDCCLNVWKDTLFPYTWQVSINSKEMLEEFIQYFIVDRFNDFLSLDDFTDVITKQSSF